ncbi:D-alanyl-D-alanine carboxypeptidase family protein [Massilicoli timonensis]|uniref:D-alanyl-D-alanine carboxypeptidase family protein n=1 Tax=Massilicoli timonensis TaxID=2015901 RepID=UPI00248C0145|nr:D-alanyl-D-alanine carboxypeptidase family protein [Massilicoli timonensis]
MKRIQKQIGFFMAFVLFFELWLFPASPKAQAQTTLASGAQSAYLMEYESGAVLFEKNADEKLYPASMTKMMGLLLIYEALNEGSLKWDDTVSASAHAASMGGSQIFLEENETMTVEDLVKAICIGSANDAMVAMAEKIGGSHEHFVEMMNEKAQTLGLTNTHFVNATGLHDKDHYSSAKDMAIIAQALIAKGGDDLLKITGTYDAYIREDGDDKFWLVNTNKLLKQYPGVDGLKTGFTQEAMSCITATAKKERVRLIAVVMKEPNSKQRNLEAKQLLDYGFSQMTQGILMKKDTVAETITLENGKPQIVKLKLKEDAIAVYPKGEQPAVVKKEITLTKELPYQKKETVATLTLTLDNQTKVKVPLYSDRNVEKRTFFDLCKHTLLALFFA